MGDMKSAVHAAAPVLARIVSPPLTGGFHSTSKGHWSMRNSSAAVRPVSNSLFWVSRSMSKSVALTPKVSMKMVRCSTRGSSRSIRSCQLDIVPMIAVARLMVPVTSCSTSFDLRRGEKLDSDCGPTRSPPIETVERVDRKVG